MRRICSETPVMTPGLLAGRSMAVPVTMLPALAQAALAANYTLIVRLPPDDIGPTFNQTTVGVVMLVGVTVALW